MGDEDFFSDPTTIFKKRKPVPIPIYDDRYIERPYLRKNELAKIRDNLDELVELKNVVLNDKPPNKPIETTKKPTEKTDEKPKEMPKESFVTDTKKINPLNIGVPESIKKEEKPKDVADVVKEEKLKQEVPKQEIPKDVKEEKAKDNVDIVKEDTKLGISNLQLLKPEQIQIPDNKPKNKIIKRKVIKRMNDEDYVPLSAEEKRRMRKAEMQEFAEETEANKAIRRSAELAELNQERLKQTSKEIEELKRTLSLETDKTKNELKSEFGNKFNELGNKFSEKFNDVTGKVDKVSGKLEETCTGIDCLKKDLANMSKNFELTECDKCGEKVVPPLSSYCPSCGSQIAGWEEDDGTPVKNWKPNWKEL